MSVIKSKRQESKLAVLTKAYELATYTITICKNEKTFPKRDRWILTQPIVRECLDAVTCIRRANAMRVATRRHFHGRNSRALPLLEGWKEKRKHPGRTAENGRMLPRIV